MILKRFFKSKPKWEHADPTIRQQAIAAIADQDQETLARLARDDADAAVRRQACRRLRRLDLLRQLSTEDPDAGARETALAHLRTLLCGHHPQSPPLEACLAELAQIEDQRLIEQVAATATHAELRRAAIARVERAEVLLSCAVGDTAAGNRLAAAQRIDDRPALEELAQRMGKKDKNLYRMVRERLRAIAARDAAPARIRAECAELCEKIERLGRLQAWSQDRALLEHLDKQWTNLSAEGETEPALQDRYQAARARFLDAYTAYRRENQAQIEAEEARDQGLREREVLIETLKQAARSEGEAELIAVVERVEITWSALPPLPEADELRLRRRLISAQEAVSSRRGQLAERRQHAEQLAALVAEAEALLGENFPLDHQAVARLHQRATALGPGGEDPALYRRLDEARTQLQERLDRQHHHAEQRLGQLPAKLEELEGHLEAGELRKAEPVLQSIQTTLELLGLCGINRRKFSELERRLQVLTPRLRELQHWRKWGTDQHRAALCETLKGLLAADTDLGQMARTLHETQVEWKRLDQSGPVVNRRLWDRFHALAEQVYQRCRPHLEQQAAEREQHRAQRAALCTELEQFLDQVDWQRMDWKKAVRAEREMRAAWASAGPVEGRHRRELERRFHVALERLDQHLTTERQRNRDHKRELIAQVEALAGAADLQQAIAETKRLQGQWHTTVAGRPSEENRLWKRFRQACDAVFSRRQVEQETRVKTAEENLSLRRAICEDLQRLPQADQSTSEMERAFAEIRERWDTLAHLEVPPRALPGLEKAWREAQSAWRAGLERRRDERERRELDLLRARAGLCTEMEGLAGDPPASGAEIDRIEAAWNAQPPLADPRLAGAMAERFTQALGAVTGSSAALSGDADNLKKRKEICLRLEILAGIDSPPELGAERLAFQVNRLTGHMRDGAEDPLQGAVALEQAWYLTGAVSPAIVTALEMRFERARAALLGNGERPRQPSPA